MAFNLFVPLTKILIKGLYTSSHLNSRAEKKLTSRMWPAGRTLAKPALNFTYYYVIRVNIICFKSFAA